MTEVRAVETWIYGLLATPIGAISGCGLYAQVAPSEANSSASKYCIYRIIDSEDETTQGSRSACEMLVEVVGVCQGPSKSDADAIAAAAETALHRVQGTGNGYAFGAIRLRAVSDHEIRDGTRWNYVGAQYTVWVRPTP